MGSSGSRHAIGLDVGGTKILGGVVCETGRILVSSSVGTPPGADGTQTVDAMLRLIGDLRRQRPDVSAIGVGAAGMVDWPSGHIRWAPNNSYRDLELRTLLSEATGLPAIVDNDANVAAWGEAVAGISTSFRDIAVLTVGTGIGAGLILNGGLYRGATGIGGEVGHVIVNPGGPQCGCGSSGCLEAMASGPALGRLGREAAAKDPAGALAVLAGDPASVTGETVFAAATAADPAACALFDEIGYWLGIGIASVVNLLDLQLIVIGGGLSLTGDLLLNPARRSLARFILSPEHRVVPPLITARLGANAGIVGAALLALDQGPT